MKTTPHDALEMGRVRCGSFATNTGEMHGKFIIRFGSEVLQIISSGPFMSESPWEHVSVSLPHKPKVAPSWKAMCRVKDFFWEKDECCIQFHPPEEVYVNVHEGCLHIWKPPYPLTTPPTNLLA